MSNIFGKKQNANGDNVFAMSHSDIVKMAGENKTLTEVLNGSEITWRYINPTFVGYNVNQTSKVRYDWFDVIKDGDVLDVSISGDYLFQVISVKPNNTVNRYYTNGEYINDDFQLVWEDGDFDDIRVLIKNSTNTDIGDLEDVKRHVNVSLKRPGAGIDGLIGRVDELEEKESKNKSIRVLFVGNSLTQDGVAYTPLLLKNLAPDVKFEFYIWYNGGFTLAQHLAYFNNNTACQIYSVCKNSTSWTNTNNTKTMAQILSEIEFDVLCVQEYFNYKTTYSSQDKADLQGVLDYIHSHYDGDFKVVTLLHRPMYATASAMESIYDLTVKSIGWMLANTVVESVIPVGTATYMAFSTDLDQLGDNGHLTPDNTHSQEGLPCMLQAYVIALWVFKQLSLPIGVLGDTTRVTTEIYNSINVPGPNIGTGLVVGTDAQYWLAQQVATKAWEAYNGAIAEQISYHPEDTSFEVGNVKSALDSLRTREKRVTELIEGDTIGTEVLNLSFVNGGIQTDGSTNNAPNRIRTNLIRVNGNFSIEVSDPTLKFNIHYYRSNSYGSHAGYIDWVTDSVLNYQYYGYIIVLVGKQTDADLNADEGSGTITLGVKEGGLAYKSDFSINQLRGINSGTKTIDVTFQQGVWNAYTGAFLNTTTRLASNKIKVDGGTVTFKMALGYKYTLALFDANDNLVSNLTTNWVTSYNTYQKLSGLHGYLVFNIANANNTTITADTDFGFELNIEEDYTPIGEVVDFQVKYNNAGFFYNGAPISLQKRNYRLRLHNGHTVAEPFNTSQQGMAIYDDIVVYGSSAEGTGGTKAAICKISDNSKLKDIVLPHGDYDGIHSNVLCFGKTQGNNSPLPHLYASQWDSVHACFVYTFNSEYTPSLVQVIIPNVSTDLIGEGNVDWIVDTDNNRLVSIGYIDASANSRFTPENGMRICVFELPALTDSTVTFTDDDVIDSFKIDDFYVRQDCCYCNGNIFMMCGFDAATTNEYSKIAVINLVSRSVLSVIDLKWMINEPEGIDVYDNSLMIRCMNSAEMYRLYFD